MKTFRPPLEALKSIGLDVTTLAREGTGDFVCASNFWRTSWDMPHDMLRRDLGDRVAIYGGIEAGANRLPTFSPAANVTREIRLMGNYRELLHANAAGKLVLGADGIEWYNFSAPIRPGCLASRAITLRCATSKKSITCAASPSTPRFPTRAASWSRFPLINPRRFRSSSSVAGYSRSACRCAPSLPTAVWNSSCKSS